MEQNAKPTYRLTAIAVALLFMGTALFVMPSVEAGTGDILLEDSSGDSVTGTFAGRAQTQTFRQIYLRHDGNPGELPIREVSFSVPESGTTPKKSIEWELATSSSTGWLANPDNNNNPNVLTFTADGATNHIAATKAKAFNIGFSVAGNPADGEKFTVTVTSRYTDNSVSKPELYTITIDDTPPAVLPTGVITQDLFDGGTEKPNGKLDAVLVAFNEVIDPGSLVLSDLKLAGYDITDAVFHRHADALPPPGDPMAVPPTHSAFIIPGTRSYGYCPSTSSDGCTILKLTISEKFNYDTGALPQFTTTARNLRDIAGNALELVGTSSVTEVDGANPLLVSALAKDLDDTNSELEGVRLTFSERVRGTAKLKLSCSEFKWNDVNTPSSSPPGGKQKPLCPGDWIITHPPGDAAPQDTNLVELQFNAPLDPLNDRDVNINSPDTLECTDLIMDLSSSGENGKGLPCLHPDADPTNDPDVAAVSIFTPNVLDTEINIGADKITVKFNVPVSDASGDTVAVRASTFDIVPTDGGGPQGIDFVDHVACTNIVVIKLDQPAKPTDVDQTPSHIRIAADRIKGCGSGAAKPLFVPSGDHPLRDATRPAILNAHTVDEDKNGVIDGFFLEFNEPVDDASFCDGVNPCPHKDAAGLAGKIAISDPDGLVGLTDDCFPEFQFDTDLAVNDRFAMLKWIEPQTVRGGLCYQDATDNRADPKDLDPAPFLDTGFVPHLLVEGATLKDLAVLVSGNTLKPTTAESLKEKDGARPIILTAHTVDRETRFQEEASGTGSTCIVGRDRLCEEDPDGYIDGYRLLFSEAVRDDTFIPQDWKVAGHDVVAVTTDYLKGDLRNDRRLVVAFTEATKVNGTAQLLHNTDAKPQLTYTAGSFSDMVGNGLESVGTVKLFEQDGSRPVIVAVEGFVNQTELKITFSEPVDDGVGEPLTRPDFVYSNGNAVGIGADRAVLNDRTSGFNNTKPVQHKPGDEVAVIALNRPLTAEDIKADRIGANVASIRESTFSVVDKQFAMTTFKPLGFRADSVAPGDIQNLVRDTARANSITLRWVAPGDDGQSNDPVAGYVFKIDTEPFNSFNATEMFAAGNNTPRNVKGAGIVRGANEPMLVSFKPGEMVGPGQTQRATIGDLNADTTYYVAAVAYDHDVGPDGRPLFTPFSGTALEITTLDDKTPPTGLLNLRSTTHPANRPVLAQVASFQWDALQDPESDVVYRYKLDQKPDTQVGQGDETTFDQQVTLDVPELGTWYFHVRGFSAGGAESATTNYKIVVGHGQLDKTAIRDYNLDVHRNTMVKRDGDANVVSWTLPDPGDLGPLESVRVWRLDGGAFVQIGSKQGDYTTLKTGTYRDDSEGNGPKSHYMVDAVFATGQDGGTPSLATYRPVPTEVQEEENIPVWVWIILAGALLLIVGGIVALAVVRSRHVPPELAAGPGLDEATGLPSHTVKCPTCTHQFKAVGELPLEITCPDCQTKGVIE